MRHKILANITETIGNTPLVRVNRLHGDLPVEILAKLEYFNPMGSVKDRIALSMIEAGEQAGQINPQTVVIEPTSGNTGIALAGICAAKGLKLILTMPDSMTQERRKLFALLGANVVLTPAKEGMRGAIQKAKELLRQEKHGFMPNQFDNPANPRIHAETTAREILDDTDGQLDMLVAGVGTGGSLSGMAQTLKKILPDLWVVAVEPANSPVLSGGMPGPHKIQGLGAGFVPPVLDRSLINEVVRCGDDLAIETARLLATREGIACGISGGAALAATLQVASRPEFSGKRAVVIIPDMADRYLSTELPPA
ncbi:Cysteine synthase [Candidatus Magnetaquicoccaceae bacterium FCR-1]|uniref:cysteine synthase n=1 Tax=Candidatus Magnetaquiglobus chichijimensis TaxID=3141448 RepID=A0ABQ0C5F3_9PROT